MPQRPPRARPSRSRRLARPYPLWFYAPSGVLFGTLFLLPSAAAFYFSMTRWTLFDSTFIGFANFVDFTREPFLIRGLLNTFVYAVLTSSLKVVLGLALALLLTSDIVGRAYLRSVVFFPVLVSTVGVGLTFSALMDPGHGLFDVLLLKLGLPGVAWLTDPGLALTSVALVDVWKGVGLATVIYMAGLAAIPEDYYEAARIDGAGAVQRFVHITLPLVRPAAFTVITLSLIGGLRSFDLIWAMTRGGPGFASDVIASVIYKQYQAGFYGLSTAGNVILFLFIAALIVPLTLVLNRAEVPA